MDSSGKIQEAQSHKLKSLYHELKPCMVRDGGSDDIYLQFEEFLEFLRAEKSSSILQYIYHLIV
jgi:hypothetical protein